MRLDFDGQKFADQCLHLMVLDEERVQHQPEQDSHRGCEGMGKMERGCESETTHGTSWADTQTICAERLIWHEMDIVEMQVGQP